MELWQPCPNLKVWKMCGESVGICVESHIKSVEIKCANAPPEKCGKLKYEELCCCVHVVLSVHVYAETNPEFWSQNGHFLWKRTSK